MANAIRKIIGCRSRVVQRDERIRIAHKFGEADLPPEKGWQKE